MTHNRTSLLLVLCGLVAFGVLGTLVGQETAASKDKGPNKSNERDKPPKTETAVQTIQMAEELAGWARRTENPAALALAAKMLDSVPTGPLDEEFAKKTTRSGKSSKPSMPEKLKQPPTSKAWLAEAKAICEKKIAQEKDKDEVAKYKAYLKAVEAIEQLPVKTRDVVGGATRHADVVMTYDTDSYKIVFRGGEPAEIAVVGDGQSDLELQVHDENRKLVVSDTTGAGRCSVRWTPKWTGPFVVSIKNRGGVDSHYTLVTN